MEDELPRRRRHRPWLGISSLTLFVCLFLPMIRVCSHDDTPIHYPFVWPPYLYGALFCVCAASRSARGLQISIAMVRILSYTYVAGSFVLVMLAPPLGLIELVAAMIITLTLGTGMREFRLATTAIVVGAMSTVWFLILCAIPDTLYGARVSLAASLGVLLAGMLWRYDIAEDKPEEAVPRAVAREI